MLACCEDFVIAALKECLPMKDAEYVAPGLR